jgi:hypothetical protein
MKNKTEFYLGVTILIFIAIAGIFLIFKTLEQ